MTNSEIARLREQLELEHRACVWALQALNSGTAQHRFITARFRRMDSCCTRLCELVGEEQTTTTLCEVFDGKQSQVNNEHGSLVQEKEVEE